MSHRAKDQNNNNIHFPHNKMLHSKLKLLALHIPKNTVDSETDSLILRRIAKCICMEKQKIPTSGTRPTRRARTSKSSKVETFCLGIKKVIKNLKFILYVA